MKNALVLSLGLLAGCTWPTASAEAPTAKVGNLDAEKFKTLAEQKGGTYLDVRTPGEVARGCIPNASVVDVSDPAFTKKVGLMQKDRPVFVYCASGNRSRNAAEQMAGMGFKEVYNLVGGISAWGRQGYPIERSAAPAVGAAGLTPAAFDALLKGEKRVLVDFHTKWCTPCRKMAPVVDSLSEAWKGRAKVVRVDVDDSEALAAREKVEGVPMFVVYVDGKERWRKSGELPRETLEAELARP